MTILISTEEGLAKINTAESDGDRRNVLHKLQLRLLLAQTRAVTHAAFRKT